MTQQEHVKEPRSRLHERREAALQALLARRAVLSDASGKSTTTTPIVEELKQHLGVSRATAYRMIKSFRSCGAVSGPSIRPVGRPKGLRVLDPRREDHIRDAIDTFYLTPQRPKFSELVDEVGRRCRAEGLPAPNWRTVKMRVQDFDAETRGSRRRAGAE
jgi:DtxR family transcriptional regulator, manganese transport regulator